MNGSEWKQEIELYIYGQYAQDILGNKICQIMHKTENSHTILIDIHHRGKKGGKEGEIVCLCVCDRESEGDRGRGGKWATAHNLNLPINLVHFHA